MLYISKVEMLLFQSPDSEDSKLQLTNEMNMSCI